MESGFERRVAVRLSESARSLPPHTLERLAQLRAEALAASARTPRLASGLGRLSLPGLGPVLMMVVVILVAVSGEVMGHRQAFADHVVVDTALLTDDLPIDAYLDPGFRAWLQRDSNS